MPNTILIVDDEPSNLSTFARVFRRDFVVRTASSAANALAELARGDVDVVISDFAMPDVNGLELLREVRTSFPKVVRLLITGHFELPELENESGLVAGVLSKPWDKGDISRMVTATVQPRL
jgi:two-component system, NtrC family, response regulator HupR/HoxA